MPSTRSLLLARFPLRARPRSVTALLLGADILTRFSRITLDYGQSRIAFGGLLRRSPPSPQAPGVRSP